jgi:hypothetical protein
MTVKVDSAIKATASVLMLVRRARGLTGKYAHVDAAGVLVSPERYSRSVFAAIEILLRAAAVIERTTWPSGKRKPHPGGRASSASAAIERIDGMRTEVRRK